MRMNLIKNLMFPNKLNNSSRMMKKFQLIILKFKMKFRIKRNPNQKLNKINSKLIINQSLMKKQQKMLLKIKYPKSNQIPKKYKN